MSRSHPTARSGVGRSRILGVVAATSVTVGLTLLRPSAADDRRSAPASERALAAGANDCTGAKALAWFAPPRALPECIAVGWDFPGMAPGEADVNGDGQPERFLFNYASVMQNGLPPPVSRDVVTLVDFVLEAGGMVVTRHPVLRSDQITPWAIAYTGGQGSVFVDEVRWNDVDDDGDLDLVVILEGGWPTPVFYVKAIWMENVGFEAAADS